MKTRFNNSVWWLTWQNTFNWKPMEQLILIQKSTLNCSRASCGWSGISVCSSSTPTIAPSLQDNTLKWLYMNKKAFLIVWKLKIESAVYWKHFSKTEIAKLSSDLWWKKSSSKTLRTWKWMSFELSSNHKWKTFAKRFYSKWNRRLLTVSSSAVTFWLVWLVNTFRPLTKEQCPT